MEEIREKKHRLLETMLLMRDDEIGKSIGEPSFLLIRKAHPDTFDMTDAIRSRVKTIGVTERSRNTEELIERTAPDTRLITYKELIGRLFHVEMTEDGRGPFRGFLAMLSGNKYFVLGFVLFLLSFAVSAKIYYRWISSVCLILAPISGILGDRKQWKNFMIFLDKRGDR